ncbi:MAG: flagellar protein FliT [Nitrospiria bacterium]
MENARESDSNEMALYETLHLLSEKILMFAEKGKWDQSISIERHRQNLIEMLRTDKKKGRLNKKSEELKRTLIHKILVADVQTRHLVEERMTGLKNQFEDGKKLVKAYGVH